MARANVTRRTLLEAAAGAAASALATPYVRGAHAGGRLTFAAWDHWVPGANNTLTRLCQEWGDKNHVEVSIDFITSIGQKNIVTASAEAQARVGHDITAHPQWQISVHRRLLEPMDDVIAALTSKYGRISPVAEYLAKHDGVWRGVPATIGSQVKPCCSRLDLYQQYCGLDLKTMFPPNDRRDKALVESWTWDLYLKTAEQLFKAGHPVGLPMGQFADAVDWTGALFQSFGSIFVDENDRITVKSDETRAALEYLKKLMAFNPPEVYAWDDASNNRWLISGKGSGIMNPPSAWAVAKRDNPQVAEQLWTHDMPSGPKGRFVGHLPYFYGVWSFATNKPAAKDLLTFISEKEQARALVAASSGYDLPSFESFYDFDTWRKVEPPPGTVYNYPPRGDEQGTVTGFPAGRMSPPRSTIKPSRRCWSARWPRPARRSIKPLRGRNESWRAFFVRKDRYPCADDRRAGGDKYARR
jgi:ABC-type glycerol-3-phosphate transport system substrate-binding protein